jgi:hypothetical protein
MSPSRALIIFDWDDTLFPTSWIFGNNIKINDKVSTKNYIVYFNELDNSIYKLLLMSLHIGKVVIVTNANINWIHLTKDILPKTSKLIESYIPIISARDVYYGIHDMNKWKIYAFNNDIGHLVSWANQIISIGDAEYEYNALISLKSYVYDWKKLKTVRLVKNPSFDTLIDQIEVITKSIDDIYKHNNHMDLNFLSR